MTLYSCHICNETFAEREEYSEHTREHLRNRRGARSCSSDDEERASEDGNPTPEVDVSYLGCPICNETFAEREEYNEHKREHFLEDVRGAKSCTSDDDEERASESRNPTPGVGVTQLSDGRYALTGRSDGEAIIAPAEDWTPAGQ